MMTENDAPVMVEGYEAICQGHGDRLGNDFKAYREHSLEKHDGGYFTITWIEEDE